MKIRKAHIVAATVAVVAFAGLANAQTATSQGATHKTKAVPAATPAGSTSAAEVETWTKKQWDAAQKEWAKDTTKWSDCQKISEKASRRSKELVLSLQLHDELKMGGSRPESQSRREF